MPVKVVVACGSGVATSQTVASKVNRMLKEEKIDASVEAVDLKSVDRHLKDAAAYITIIRDKKEYDVPVIDGIAFLTGVGQKQQFDKLVEAIKNYKAV
ncbi:PTS sugar transporter subunit IIB [Olsenella uli]|uniref:PTS sugar transporter subunit IIB n=1 Tax=Olsenella uli TaxID=133926 RepID=UPI00195BE98D|nr:PTS sugar transporter subunit IIB [Olsenella uli]MBM6676916.1 PTS sugar transporter subunit IIB [Olsenella uli]